MALAVMGDKTNLEVTWIEKDNQPKLELCAFRGTERHRRRREQLIAEIEGKLQQKTMLTQVFSLTWKLK